MKLYKIRTTSGEQTNVAAKSLLELVETFKEEKIREIQCLGDIIVISPNDDH